MRIELPMADSLKECKRPCRKGRFKKRVIKEEVRFICTGNLCGGELRIVRKKWHPPKGLILPETGGECQEFDTCKDGIFEKAKLLERLVCIGCNKSIPKLMPLGFVPSSK